MDNLLEYFKSMQNEILQVIFSHTRCHTEPLGEVSIKLLLKNLSIDFLNNRYGRSECSLAY